MTYKTSKSTSQPLLNGTDVVMVLQSQVAHGMAKPGKYFWNLPFQMAWRALVYISPAMMYNFGTFIEAQS